MTILFPAAAAAEALDALRARGPVLHLLTSPVAGKISVDAALALGAEPSLSQTPDEVRGFMGRTDGLLINLGMYDPAREAAAEAALSAYSGPWALDPVKVDRSAGRLAIARALAKRGPAVIKANMSEAEALGGSDAVALWRTGVVDDVCYGDFHVRLSNGHPLMARTTAVGCAAGAVLTALLTVVKDAGRAAACAAAICGVAGEVAAARCAGPGGFPAAWIDALHGLTPRMLERLLKHA